MNRQPAIMVYMEGKLYEVRAVIHLQASRCLPTGAAI